jgi:hypothetical protein
MSMTATLNDMIRYENGTITVVEAIEEPYTVDDAELIESGLKGWGESNAVVKHGDGYYLATVAE